MQSPSVFVMDIYGRVLLPALLCLDLLFYPKWQFHLAQASPSFQAGPSRF